MFGDEIELRAQSLRADCANPVEILRLMVSHAGLRPSPASAGCAPCSSVLAGRQEGRRAQLPHRLRGRRRVRQAPRLGRTRSAPRWPTSFERWNGRVASPGAAKGRHPAPDAGRAAQPGARGPRPASRASTAPGDHPPPARQGLRPRAHRPRLATPDAWWDAVEPADPWDAALAARAAECPPLDDAAVHERCSSSPTSPTSSRRGPAATPGGGRPGPRGVRAGRPRRPRWCTTSAVAVPNTDLGQARPAHPRRARPRRDPRAGDRPAAPTGALHRRAGRRGGRRARTRRRIRLPPTRRPQRLDDAQRVLAAADCYQAMTSDRPYRAGAVAHAAAAELRTMAAAAASTARPSSGSSPPPATAAAPGRRCRPGSPHARPRCCACSRSASPPGRSPTGW